MKVTITTEGVRELAADLESVPVEKAPAFRRVVERGALNIKNEMRRDAQSSGHYRHFHRSISYDMTGEMSAEIGPDKDKIQGALGNILYFGTSNNAPVLSLEAPLEHEEPRFEKALADEAEDIL